jgi:hypothetical protein
MARIRLGGRSRLGRRLAGQPWPALADDTPPAAAAQSALPVEVDLAQLFPPGVTNGQPLAWRDISPDGRYHFFNDRILAGHLDDSGSEVLLLASEAGNRCFRADRTKAHALDAAAADLPSDIVCLWDYDGDGVDDAIVREVVKRLPEDSPTRFNPDQALVAYSITGARLGVVQRGDVSAEPLLCDLDGDGRADLLVPQATSDSPADAVWTGFGAGGKVLFTAGQGHHPYPFGFVADVEGTGRDVLVGLVDNNKYLEYGVGRNGKALPTSVAKLLTLWSPDSYAVSQDGHGRDTLADSIFGRYIDLHRGAVYAFDPPPGLEPADSYMDEPGPWAEMSMYFLGDRHPLAAFHEHGSSLLAGFVTPRLDSGRSGYGADIFCIWQRDGKLVHAENLGEAAQQILTLHACDGDHVVLLTNSRLLIWP